MSAQPDIRLALARAFDEAPLAWEVELHEEVPEGSDLLVIGPDIDHEGGIAFDPGKPEALLAEVAEALEGRHRGRLVVVVGATGGCGVTGLALHLARELAPCCVVESHPDRGLRERVGMGELDCRTWSPSCTARELAEAALPVPGGFRVLLAPREEDRDASSTIYANARDLARHVVVDAGTRPHEGLLADAGACVLVVPPTLPGALRAARLLELAPHATWAVVLNRLGPGGEMPCSMLRAMIGRPIAVELPCCPQLRDAEDSSRLVGRGLTRWARRVRQLARALDQHAT